MTTFTSPLPAGPLTAGLEPEEVRRLLCALHPSQVRYGKGCTLLLAGYENHRIGLVLEGSIEAVKTGPAGEQFLMAHMGPGGVFGDVLCGSSGYKSPVTVTAKADVTVLWLPYDAVLAGPGDPALKAAHTQLLRNLVGMMADKYFALDGRLDLLLVKSLRLRVLGYLRTLPAGPDGWRRLPLSRTQLAAYLGCDRAALSRELGRMAQDGLVALQGSQVRILAERRVVCRQGPAL